MNMLEKIIGDVARRAARPKMHADIPPGLKALHTDIIERASNLQAAASAKYERIPVAPNSEAAFHRLHQFALVQHRATLALCEHGWSQAAPSNVRTLLECLINLGVIVEKDSEYRAFQYLYGYVLLALRRPDPSLPNGPTEKGELQSVLDKGIGPLEEPLKSRVLEWTANGELPGNYWYSEYYKGPSLVVKNLLPSVLPMYRIFSSTSHGGFFGTYFFLDAPENPGINAQSNPRTAKFLVGASCRFSIEICHLRSRFQQLNQDGECEVLRHRLSAYNPDAS